MSIPKDPLQDPSPVKEPPAHEHPPAEKEPPPEEPVPEEKAKIRLDPTRYGDWELNGKCVDF